MISAERIQEMVALFWAETNEEWTQEWRDELTKEEAALVCRWDRDFEMGLSKMCDKQTRI